MVVDDYVPVFEDSLRPLLCGTVNKQIWVMLIFKAWAKICGSYSKIQGEDCYSFLNAFSTGPCFSYILHPSLHEDKETMQQIVECFHSNNAICVTTTNNPKHKLKADSDYAIRRYRGGMVELVGQGMNEKVAHKLSLDDLCVNCCELNVSKSEQNCINSEENQLILNYNKPFFMKFELSEPYSLTLSFWKDSSDNLDRFMRVVVARKTGSGKFTYVASKLEAFYQ